MSDVMFYGGLRMPYEMAMGDELSRRHFYDRAQQAADRVEKAEAALSTRTAGDVQPVAWIRRHPGTLTGELLMDAAMSDLRKTSGAWVLLSALPLQGPAPAAAPCEICDGTRVAFGKRCECAATGGPP